MVCGWEYIIKVMEKVFVKVKEINSFIVDNVFKLKRNLYMIMYIIFILKKKIFLFKLIFV